MLKRNPLLIKSIFYTQNDAVFCKKKCKIQIPKRYIDIGLGKIDDDIQILGCFAIILEPSNEYAVFNINGLVNIKPESTSLVKVGEDDYYEFHFDVGSIFISSTDILQLDTLIYEILNEFFLKGKVPWFIEYEDLGKIFSTAKHYAGSAMGDYLITIEILTSIVGKYTKDKTKYIRSNISKYSDVKNNVSFIRLTDVAYSVHSTINKLVGPYFNESITSALTNETKSIEKIEEVLRS